MKTKISYSFLMAILAVFSLNSCSKESPKKPNIVFLFIDDFAYDALHCYGNTVVKTPNIDKLAAHGTRFTNAYNMGSWSGAVCTASRSMMISGMSVWRTNANRENWHTLDSSSIANSWGKLMEKAGYDTYMTGKWHVDLAAPEVFQQTTHIRPGMPGDKWRNMSEAIEAYEKGEKTYAEIMPKGYNRPLSPDDHSWSPTDTTNGGFWEGGKHWSEVLKDDAIKYMDQAKNSSNPFFMYLAFNAAHDPRQSPQKYIDMYPLDSIKLPENFQEDYFLHDEVGVGYKLRDEALAPFPRTAYAVKVHLQEYYALITHLDDQIGEIIKNLEEKGLMENTYIMLTADHGLAMGSHGLLGKQNMYDHSMRVPFIIDGPNIPKGNVATQDVYLQDVMATSLDLAQIQKPDFVEFNSVLPLIADQNKKSYADGIYGAYLGLQRMIRKDGFKLIVYPKANKTLLFDLKNDPFEMNNLADAPEFKEKKEELFAGLLKLQKQLNDPLNIEAITL